jgi:transcriptional regulator with XRE-family HTH domain
MSKAELARRLAMSPANIHKIFKRDSVDVKLLYRLCQELRYDFLALYHIELIKDLQSGTNLELDYGSPERKLHIQSLDRRIDLIDVILRDLHREDFEAKLTSTRDALGGAGVIESGSKV